MTDRRSPTPCTESCYAMPECTRCHNTKKPHGRAEPLEMAGFYCASDCPEYNNDPKPGHLWPGEPVDGATSYFWTTEDSGLPTMANTKEGDDE